MIRKVLFPLLFLVGLLTGFPSSLQAQWTDAAQVSVLTCAPGDELYSIFGHSALRVQDLAQRPAVDRVFNYGTFQFNDGFYARFLRGELVYTLSAAPYHHFQREYFDTSRGMREQTLDLTPLQVAKVAEFLYWNARPENRDYRYEFFYDNCSSRILDVLRGVLREELHVPCPVRADSSYRQLLWPNLGAMPAVRFGMDIVLGMPADAKLGACGDAYLPDHLFVHLDEATLVDSLGRRPLVSRTESLLPHLLDREPEGAGWPAAAAWALLLIIAVEWRTGRRAISVVLPWIAGLTGLLMAALWFATAHTDTRLNLNLLWAFPGLLIPWRKLRRASAWAAASFAMLFVVFEFLPSPPQSLHGATFPLALALVFCIRPWEE